MLVADQGGGLVDVADNRIAVTANSAASRSASPYGPALTFNGTSNYYTFTYPITTNALTLSGFVAPTSLSAIATVIVSRDSGEVQLMQSFNTGNPITGSWNGGSNEYNAATGLNLTLGQWQYVAMSVNSAGIVVYLGINGTLSSFVIAEGNSARTLTNWAVGYDAAAGARWAGGIDRVCLYPRALTAAEHQVEYLDPWWRLRRRNRYGLLTSGGAAATLVRRTLFFRTGSRGTA